MQAQDLVSIPTLTPPLEFDLGGLGFSLPTLIFVPLLNILSPFQH